MEKPPTIARVLLTGELENPTHITATSSPALAKQSICSPNNLLTEQSAESALAFNSYRLKLLSNC